MSVDLSVQNPNDGALRRADALLRANGGTVANLQMPAAPGDATDQGQLGINAPDFQMLPLSPALFRAVRTSMTEGQPEKYELLVSASAVQAQVSALQLNSAQALFAMAAGVVVAGKLFVIEAVSSSESQGQVYLYRLGMRETATDWQM